MSQQMTFQNEIEILAQSNNLTLSVWRSNKSGRTIVTVALHTGERATQFRYQGGVVWSAKQTVELTGRQFVGDDVSQWCAEMLGEARKYLQSLVVTETVYEITDDSFGGDAGDVATLSEIKSLYAGFESTDGNWEFEISERIGAVRLYATRTNEYDVDCQYMPTRYSNWVKISNNEMYLDIARIVEVANV